MATIELTIDDEKIQQRLRVDRGMAILLEPILNQILQAEMTESPLPAARRAPSLAVSRAHPDADRGPRRSRRARELRGKGHPFQGLRLSHRLDASLCLCTQPLVSHERSRL